MKDSDLGFSTLYQAILEENKFASLRWNAMDRMRFILCFWLAVILNVAAEEEPKVCIKDGCLIGITETSRLGREYFSFLGIPFAKPPIDKLRFKPPERPEPWETLRAKRDGKICPRTITYPSEDYPETSEDCLYLNVYTPQISVEGKLDGKFPVIVVFHTGGFQFWSGTRHHFPGNYFLDHDVVIVSANYRLNVFGFLSTEDLVSPGNYALKDQRRVLEWVQENIAVFGGDPESVTIQGQGAGGASVHFHMLSPSSKGLFHRAIAQSGTALAPWAFSMPLEAREHAHYLGKHLGCPLQNTTALVECLRWKSVDELLEADPIFFVWGNDPLIPWKPSVEPEHEGAFLTQAPLEILESGNFTDVPLLIGATSHEGLYRAAGILESEPARLNWNALPLKSYSSALNLHHLSVEELKDTITRLRNYYFNSDKVFHKHRKQFINMFSDRYFFRPMAKTVRYHANRTSPIFAYRFDYIQPRVSFTKYYMMLDEEDLKTYKAVCHSDDLMYFYPLEKTLFPDLKHREESNAMIDRMLGMWINFVNHGHPTPEGYDVTWEPVESEGIEYLKIKGPNDLKMTPGFYNKRLLIWDDLKLERAISKDSAYIKEMQWLNNTVKHDEL